MSSEKWEWKDKSTLRTVDNSQAFINALNCIKVIQESVEPKRHSTVVRGFLWMLGAETLRYSSGPSIRRWVEGNRFHASL